MARKRKWSYKTYGKTATRQKASFSAGGLEEYLQRVQQTDRDVDEAVKEAVYESAKIVWLDMMEGAEPHIRTGAVYNAIELKKPVQIGNVIYSGVGIDTEEKPEAIHAVFQEYGSPTFPADPFIRPAFDNNKSKVKKKQREVLKKAGMPVD